MPPSVITLGKSMGLPSSRTETISQYGRGRGIGFSSLLSGECLCERPRCHYICHACGYLGWGRIRFICPQHPQTIFLIDMSQCPNCMAYAFMMSEF